MIDQSAANYTKAVELTRVKKDGAGEGEKYNYLTSLGSLYSENQQLELAVEYFIQALEFGRNNQIWQVEQVIARVYAQLGDDASAMLYATRALQNAPEDRRAEVQALINLLQQSSP